MRCVAEAVAVAAAAAAGVRYHDSGVFTWLQTESGCGGESRALMVRRMS